MEYRLLGRTGLYVSSLSLGTMGFGGANAFWRNIGDLTPEDAKAQVSMALDAGVNLFDTADFYSMGGSEALLGETFAALGVPWYSVLISTKARLRVGPGPNDVGLTRHHLMRQAEESLKRLKADHIDLYYLHSYDPLTPIDETLRALDDLVRSGKVRYVGCSNFHAWRMMKALGVAERLSLPRMAAAQVYMSLVGRDVEREITPLALEEGVSLVAWSPLAAGFLARTEAPNETTRRGAFDYPPVVPEEGARARAAMKEVCARHDAPAAAVAIAWAMGRPGFASITVGGRTKAQLSDALRAAELKLTAEDLALLDAAAPPKPDYPGYTVERHIADRAPDAVSVANIME